MVGVSRQPGPTVRLRRAINDFLVGSFPPGPAFIPLYISINLQKIGSLPFCIFLCVYYDNFSPGACVYTACHGVYGLCWMLKHWAFEDRSWRTKVTLISAINSWVAVLGLYWVAPWLLISRRAPAASIERLGACVVVFVLGVVIMMVADAQKHFTLAVKKGLITTGMFRHVRHPNYLGEMMLYGALAGMVLDSSGPYGLSIPWLILAWVWIQVFHTNICMKECSMSRYDEWESYVARTGMLLPWPPALLGAE